MEKLTNTKLSARYSSSFLLTPFLVKTSIYFVPC